MFIYLCKGWMTTKTKYLPYAQFLKGLGWVEISEADYNALSGINALAKS